MRIQHFRWITAILAIAVAVSCDSSTAQEADAAKSRGERLYNAHCAICHSIGGTGGRGPRLDVAKLRRAQDDSTLARIVRGGIPGTEMPGSWMISSQDAREIVAYVRSLSRRGREEVPGDAAAGRAIYDAQDCSNCHIIDGEGSSLGPDLSDIGLRRSAEYLRNELVRPAAASPNGFMMIYAVPASGVPVEGIRVNEDSFSVQIRDAENRFHSFRKAELKTYRKQRNKSLMPSYGEKLSREEMDNMVAYLVSLLGEE
jgi:cytochrome c oxidase cbb3-type subunit 3